MEGGSPKFRIYKPIYKRWWFYVALVVVSLCVWYVAVTVRWQTSGGLAFDHSAFLPPLIEWGGMLFLLATTLSPFLIIRHRMFRPTRWWHIVGAYLVSFVIFVIFSELSLVLSDYDRLTELRYIYHMTNIIRDISSHYYISLIVAYPILIFYSTKLLYGPLSRVNFWISIVIASLFFLILFLSHTLATATFFILLYTNAYLF
jgi:hypothetical protein